MESKLFNNQFGQEGAEVITDTAAHPGSFISLQALSDAVIAAVTAPNLTGNSLVGQTIPAGVAIYGRFTSITLTSGSLIAYKSAP
jgi:hypothetical protein